LSYAGAEYHSVYGRIRSYWKTENGKLTMHVIIPPNTTANIHVPAESVDKIYDGDVTVNQAEGIRVTGTLDNRIILKVGSGEYRIEVR
jgi:alpha-L-rhamnosidase